MSLPSIKLNIFKKLEYFLVLKKLNKQFDVQFKALKNRKWIEEEKKYEGAYPVWEIEKKVLFWTYSFHKFLGREITSNHFEGMFISEEESKIVGGQANIFGNLNMRGFAEKIDECNCKISKEGLAFGELLWYLYVPIVKNGMNTKNDYFDIYKTDYYLGRSSFGWIILQTQLFSIYLLPVYALAFFTLEILDKLFLLNNLRDWILNVRYISAVSVWASLSLLPFAIFTLSLVFDFLYMWIIVDRKYKGVEEIAKERENKAIE